MIYFFDKKVPLETERLIIRPLQISDKNEIIRLFNNGRTKFLAPIMNDDEYKSNYVHLTEELFEKKSRLVYAIIRKEDYAFLGIKHLDFVGTVITLDDKKLYKYDGIATTTSLLNIEFEGNGYMTEASIEIFTFLFANYVRAISVTIKPDNLKAINYCKRIGFKEITYEDYRKLKVRINIEPDFNDYEKLFILLSPKFDEIAHNHFNYLIENGKIRRIPL